MSRVLVNRGQQSSCNTINYTYGTLQSSSASVVETTTAGVTEVAAGQPARIQGGDKQGLSRAYLRRADKSGRQIYYCSGSVRQGAWPAGPRYWRARDLLSDRAHARPTGLHRANLCMRLATPLRTEMNLLRSRIPVFAHRRTGTRLSCGSRRTVW